MSRLEEINQAITDLAQEIKDLEKRIKQLKQERTTIQAVDRFARKLDEKKKKVKSNQLDIDTLDVVYEGWSCVEQLRKMSAGSVTTTPSESVMIANVYIKSLTDTLPNLTSDKVRTEAIELIQTLTNETDRVTGTSSHAS